MSVFWHAQYLRLSHPKFNKHLLVNSICLRITLKESLLFKKQNHKNLPWHVFPSEFNSNPFSHLHCGWPVSTLLTQICSHGLSLLLSKAQESSEIRYPDDLYVCVCVCVCGHTFKYAFIGRSHQYMFIIITVHIP